MPWIRLEASSGLRIMAPSFGLPPRVEGIDKLFDRPINARLFCCFSRQRHGVAKARDAGGSPKTASFFATGEENGGEEGTEEKEEEILVLVERQQIGGRLGEVTIAVGGESFLREELDIVLDIAFDVIRHTNNSGARLIFDALCTSLPPHFWETDDVMEYDGLPTKNGSCLKGRREGGWRAEDPIPRDDKLSDDSRRSFFLRRQALLYFVCYDVLPISLLHCHVSASATDVCTPSTSSVATAQNCSKGLQSTVKTAACACSCLVTVIDRTLTAAFGVTEGVNQHKQLWGGQLNEFLLVAVFSTSGLLCASPSFFSRTNHRDRLILAAVAIDQLCRWPKERGASAHIQLIHAHDLLLNCLKGGTLLNLVFLCVGNAVCCVFGFYQTDATKTRWEASTLMHFVTNNLMTLKSTIVDDDDAANNGDGSRSSAFEFTPHLLLCRAPVYPTPWFHRLMYDMDKLEKETPRAVLVGGVDGSKRNTDTSAERLVYFDFCSLLSGGGKKAKVTRQFVWHTDTVDLSLDVAWCVASSHIVRAEAIICCGGRELGHHSFFSFISSGVDDAKEMGRYSVGCFQHCWRNMSGSGLDNSAGKEGDHVNCLTNLVNPTKLLRGFSSIGRGFSALTRYERRPKSFNYFSNRCKIEVCGKGDVPVFNSHMMLVPYSFLLDDKAAEDCTLTDDAHETRCITAFYAIVSHKVKGARCDALVEKVLLMEGDMTDSEEKVSALLQRKHKPTSFDESSAWCYNVAWCVLEDVWRLFSLLQKDRDDG